MLNAYGKVDRLVGIYQTLSAMPQNPNGVLGRYALDTVRLCPQEQGPQPAHLRLIARDGRLIA